MNIRSAATLLPMTTKNRLRDICKQFRIDGAFLSAVRYGNGRINDTFLTTHASGSESTKQIVQRINKNVFLDPAALMNNYARVCRHVEKKLRERGVEEPHRRCLTLFNTLDGDDYLIDDSGEFWRAFNFVGNAVAHEFAPEPEHAKQAAKAFGLFQRYLSDFDEKSLVEIIPGFHDTVKRFEALERAIEADGEGRAQKARAGIDFAIANKGFSRRLIDLKTHGALRSRVVHNDTKINNILIDNETREAICVIDLDTVGPGLPHYDFGDFVRSACSTTSEGETDRSKIDVDMAMFDAAISGYLSDARHFLSPREIDALAESGCVLAFELGLRFLTDYLEGDQYFKVKRPDENLTNCAAQFKLTERLQAREPEMRAHIDRVMNEPFNLL